MDNLETLVENYLEYCSTQKCLDAKTLKAYRIDLRQFSEQTFPHEVTEITSKTLEDYIAKLHQQYKPKTVNISTGLILFNLAAIINEAVSLKAGKGVTSNK